MQLEEYDRRSEETRTAPWENEFRILGWTIQRAAERDRSEKPSVPSMSELPETVKAMPLWPVVEPKEEDLPVRIMQQLEQFHMNHVIPLQKGTQKFYNHSLELLYKYLAARFGQRFDWNMLDEETLTHFLAVWYIDHAKTTTRGSRIFLNTLKHLFRWLDQEGICDVYERFRKLYVTLIHALPTAVEAGRWIRQHGLSPSGERNDEESVMVMLAMSSTGPVLRVNDRWVPAHLAGFPWTNQRFWVRGRFELDDEGCRISRVDGVYPVLLPDKQLKVLGNP
ncbi:hypothetical protein [Staphylospora marina]|uniref:hypothetical protein n=1 Tax=Staphylospora marina TaxID=2490858 RepID=UPI001F15660B|nr:hypothetical protein [Staphylospora marina]